LFCYVGLVALEMVGELDVFPEWAIVGRDVWGRDGNGKVMEDHIPSCFKCPAIVCWVGYPNKIPFCVTCVTEKMPSFATRFKFRSAIGEYTRGAFCAKWAEVGEIRLVFEP
jgi:hypothetical protein